MHTPALSALSLLDVLMQVHFMLTTSIADPYTTTPSLTNTSNPFICVISTLNYNTLGAGPGNYDNPDRTIVVSGGKFNASKPKSELDWVIHRANQVIMAHKSCRWVTFFFFFLLSTDVLLVT